MKYRVVKANSDHFPVTMICRLLSVSVSGYYGMRERPLSSRMQKNAALSKKIKFIFDEDKCRPGAILITKRLRAEGHDVGRHRVAKIMHANGWRTRAAKKYKATTNSNHKLPVSPNLLQQYFEASKPNEKFVTDITYVWTDEGWLYLATVWTYIHACSLGGRLLSK